MKIFNLVSSDLILETLNSPQPSEVVRADMVNRYIERRGKVSRPEWRALHVVEVSHWLRYYVEEWLKTGLKADGREYPRDKDLFRTFYAKLAVIGYLEKHPAHVSLSPGSPGLQVTIGRIPRGEISWNEFFLTRVTEAERLLTAVMTSDWKECLCKCRYAPCSKYFLLKKPRQSYRHGTFCCRHHQSFASATALTNERRTWANDALINYAASQLLKWGTDGPQWQNDASRKLRLASVLSGLIRQDPNLRANRQFVKVNWVTRHRREIEQKRRELTVKRDRKGKVS